MNVLGIHQGHDSGASIAKDGKIIHAVNEERFTRIKNDPRFPHDCIKYLSQVFDFSKLDLIAFPNASPERMTQLKREYDLNHGEKYSELQYKFFCHNYQEILKSNLDLSFHPNLKQIPVEFVEHHESHAASAYYTSGFNESLVITLDGEGDFLCGSVWIGKGKTMERVQKIYRDASIGAIWGMTTGALGFKPSRHEGKVMGLAAYTEPDPEVTNHFENMVEVDGTNLKLGSKGILQKRYEPTRIEYAKALQNYDPLKICASLQKATESIVVQWIQNLIRKYEIGNISLAGGVFANVKLNQKISEIEGVEHIWIFPNMGDGGLCSGAALSVSKKLPYKMPDAYLGCSYPDEYVQELLEDLKLKYERTNPREISEKIDNGEVVGLIRGSMEFGARALGNRSILAKATDSGINDILNKRMRRSEFMPFAPVIPEEYTKYLSSYSEKVSEPCGYMTITQDASKIMSLEAPAAVHKDGTARPQIIRNDTNKFYHRILIEYENLSDSPVLVNTSFNMHEEPIIREPLGGVVCLMNGVVDSLVLNDFLVEL